ncbi:MAG: glyoxylate/hydroxypyruvate reductase A [Proteobacteria bacterium]|nr:glyoxylate/hydroxypyruvate reductase A [Pseudomonadota bacterium]
MAMLYMSQWSNGDLWRDLMTGHLPGLDFRIHPETGNPADIEAVLVWRYPLDELRSFPNLKMIASLGAGVDHVVGERHLIPEGVTLTRIVDPAMTAQMTEWCVMAVLNRLRRWDDYRAMQGERRYEELEVPRPDQTTIGVLGLGELGSDCARVLAAMGYTVRAWSRSPRRQDGVTCLQGADAMQDFLAPCDIVICLLPLTRETRGILDARSLGWMKRGAYIVNAARGAHIVEADLIAAIDAGHIAGATVDVQSVEPMPPDHPFWYHPRIVSFPHVAALTVPESCTAGIAANYRRMQKGEPLENVVDLERGY